MTVQELNNILIKQNQHLAVEKFQTGYECFSIHTNKLYALANTVDELYTKLLKTNLISQEVQK
jgi:hypothetical protein